MRNANKTFEHEKTRRPKAEEQRDEGTRERKIRRPMRTRNERKKRGLGNEDARQHVDKTKKTR